jgi:hypothetical protein
LELLVGGVGHSALGIMGTLDGPMPSIQPLTFERFLNEEPFFESLTSIIEGYVSASATTPSSLKSGWGCKKVTRTFDWILCRNVFVDNRWWRQLN